MNPKYNLTILLLTFLLCQRVNSQKNIPVDNISIRFTVLRTSLQLLDSNRISPSRYLINVKLSESEKKHLKAFPKTFWIKCLQSSSTDWAANLILYDLYEKDALLYWNMIKSRSDWIIANKNDDFDYWSIRLK